MTSCFVQRATSAERQAEQLREQLAAAAEGEGRTAVTHKSTNDMEQAIDILKRSSLEVELAAKEKEVSTKAIQPRVQARRQGERGQY